MALCLLCMVAAWPAEVTCEGLQWPVWVPGPAHCRPDGPASLPCISEKVGLPS